MKRKEFKISKAEKILLIIIAVLIAIPAIGFVGYKTNESYINTRLLYAVSPKTATVETSTGKMDFFYEYKKGSDPRAYDETIYSFMKIKLNTSALDWYYLNKDGEKTYIGIEGVYNDNGTEITVSEDNSVELEDILKPVKTVIAVYVLVLICLIILFWFFNWSRREDEKQALLNSKKNIKKKKN